MKLGASSATRTLARGGFRSVVFRSTWSVGADQVFSFMRSSVSPFSDTPLSGTFFFRTRGPLSGTPQDGKFFIFFSGLSEKSTSFIFSQIHSEPPYFAVRFRNNHRQWSERVHPCRPQFPFAISPLAGSKLTVTIRPVGAERHSAGRGMFFRVVQRIDSHPQSRLFISMVILLFSFYFHVRPHRAIIQALKMSASFPRKACV